MPETRRQLAAIMFTDLVGYTKLMGEDEEMAMRTLEKSTSIQKDIIEKYKGVVLKEIGDGLLVMFISAVEAVKCAIEIQQLVKDEGHINLKIGIHLGDVVIKENDVFGDGVNIASRAQELAAGGEILVTEPVFKNISNQVGIKTKFFKEALLKNVKDPMMIYNVLGDFHSSRKKSKSKLIVPFGIAIIIGVIYTIFDFADPTKDLYTRASFINEYGETESISLLKEDYEIKIGIGKFINTNETDSLNWLVYGLNALVSLDLEFGELISCPNVYIDSESNITELIDNTSFNDLDYFLLGSFTSNDTAYNINCKFYNRHGYKLLDEVITSNDEFNLVDKITSKIYSVIDKPEEININLDFPIKDISTKSRSAFISYASGFPFNFYSLEKFREAIKFDSTFIQAYFALGNQSLELEDALKYYEKGLMYRNRLRKREQLVFVMEYHIAKEDKLKGLEIANSIIQKSPKSYSRINKAVDLLGLYPDTYKEYRSKSLELFESLDEGDKLTLFDRAAFMGDESLIKYMEELLEEDPLNEDYHHHFLRLLYGTRNFDLMTDHLDLMKSLFPEYEENLEACKKLLNNVGITLVSGDYIGNLKYIRTYLRNPKGILFLIYNHRHQGYQPVFEVDSLTFAYFSPARTTTERLSKLGNGMKHFIQVGKGIPRYFIPSPLKNTIKEITFKGKIYEPISNFEKTIADFKDHDFVSLIKNHLLYLDTSGNDFSKITGSYENEITIQYVDGKLVKNGLMLGQRYSSDSEFLYPINDSVFFSSRNTSRRLVFTNRNGQEGIVSYYVVPGDSTGLYSFAGKIN